MVAITLLILRVVFGVLSAVSYWSSVVTLWLLRLLACWRSISLRGLVSGAALCSNHLLLQASVVLCQRVEVGVLWVACLTDQN